MLQDGKHVHTSAEEYDTGKPTSGAILAAHLPCERKYHTACELNGTTLLLLPAPVMAHSQAKHHAIALAEHILCGRAERGAALDGSCICAGRLYAVGGMTKERQRLRSVVALDPREGRWREVAHPCVCRAHHAALASLHGRLFAAGGNAGDSQFHATVEAYVPEADKWQSCAPFSQGRSSLALAAVAT